MKTTKILTILVLALGLIVWSAKVSQAAPMGTGFTYQGRLIDANNAADGLYDFQFKLFDANVAGTQKGSAIDVNELDVIDGYFTVLLDFGSDVFDGNAVWLQIGIRPGEQNDPYAYKLLSPRQEITTNPYALQTRGIFVDNGGNVGIGTASPTAKLEVNGNIKTAAIYESGIGDNWTAKGPSMRWWDSVAMSADGTKQTAVINSGRIYVSTDSGNTWTAKESSREWSSVAMSADGTKQTAVNAGLYGSFGQIYVSTDSGNTWTAKGPSLWWSSVAMSADGTKQTAVVYNGQIYISTDSGNNWTAKESKRYWSSVAMSADGTKQTAVVSATGQIYVSTDSGNTWVAKEQNRSWASVAMSADGTKQTAVVYAGQIYVSTDSGNTWVPVESNREWMSVAMSADGTKLTAVADDGQIYISTDSGNNWTPKESNRHWRSVAMSADGTKQTAVVGGGDLGQIYISSIGVGIGTTNPAGKLDVNGSIYQRGSVLHADYVFEPGYKLESIDEHSEFMWQEKHLPAMPKIQKDENGQEMVEIGARSRGVVEELEKAHIYIEQLHKRITTMEERLAKLEARACAKEMQK